MARTVKILVVDDSNLYGRILCELVSSLQGCYLVGHAKDGLEALHTIRRKTLDLVLLDVEMPNMNGFETLKALKHEFPELCVVMVSGSNTLNADITIKALQHGAFDFIPKPTTASNPTESRQALLHRLTPIIRMVYQTKQEALKQAHHETIPLLTSSEEIPRQYPEGDADLELSGVDNAELKDLANTRKPDDSLSPEQQERLAKMSRYESALNANPIRPGGALRERPANKAPRDTRHELSKPQAVPPKKTLPKAPTPKSLAIPCVKPQTLNGFRPDLIVVGVSTGGPSALLELIPHLPADLGLPVLLVQHMPPQFTLSLASSLAGKAKLLVKEAQDGEALQANTVYIAPGGSHMVVKKAGKQQRGTLFHQMLQIRVNQDDPVNSCRPSVDTLFKSVAKEAAGRHILSVIMTGMGQDGMEGVKTLKQVSQCYSITQSAETCSVYGMPRAVDEAGLSDEQLPLSVIVERVSALVGRRISTAR